MAGASGVRGAFVTEGMKWDIRTRKNEWYTRTTLVPQLRPLGHTTQTYWHTRPTPTP